MRIIINSESEAQAVRIAHHVEYLVEEAQETGTCIATFAPVPVDGEARVYRAEIHKTKTGYSITSWDAGSYKEYMNERINSR